MGSTQKTKKLSRRKRREIVRRQKTRQTVLRLVPHPPNGLSVMDEHVTVMIGSAALAMESPPLPVADTNDSVPPSGEDCAPCSERVIRSASVSDSSEEEVPPTAGELGPFGVGFVVENGDDLDDDVPILGTVRSTVRPSSNFRRRETSSEVAEKQAALLRALAAYLDAASNERSDFSQVAYAFEGKLLRLARIGIAEESDDPPPTAPRSTELLNRNAAWEREFLAALEAVLLDLALQERVFRDQSRRAQAPQHMPDLTGFGHRLWMCRFNARANDVLGKHVFGKDVMRHIHRRLAQRTPPMMGAPRFTLYNVNPVDIDRAIGPPTFSGLHVWSEMRKRLLRGASKLARYLKKEYGY
ncbi:MAG TPA: hypothetical protein VN397_00625 [Candidatus Methylomirabilis sp.]|nr:hypothetical protein [Candidatus Methylomirabilis sp.]